MVSVKSSNNKVFTIYDGDFNVVKEFADPTAGQPYLGSARRKIDSLW